jgi:hypothetical protein
VNAAKVGSFDKCNDASDIPTLMVVQVQPPGVDHVATGTRELGIPRY